MATGSPTPPSTTQPSAGNPHGTVEPASAAKTTTQGPIGDFVEGLAKATGLNDKVIAAWVLAEGAFTANGTGHYNYLNVRPATGGKSYSGVGLVGVSPGNFQEFGSVQDAVTETAHWINTFSNYAVIRSSVKLGPMSQLAAIQASPWDQGQYAGGKLQGAYAQVNTSGGGHFLGINWGKVNTYFDPGGGAGIPDPYGQGKKVVKDVTGGISSVGGAVSWISNTTNLLRVGEVIAGSVLVALGTVLLARSVGGVNIQTPAAPTIDLRGKGEKQYTSRSYGTSREGTGKIKTESFSLDEPKPDRSASRSSQSDDIPF